jgi:hypothetical protein
MTEGVTESGRNAINMNQGTIDPCDPDNACDVWTKTTCRSARHSIVVLRSGSIESAAGNDDIAK